MRDRLAMIKYLIEANHPLSVPTDAGPTKGSDGLHDGGWLHSHAQLDGLVSYLLLTCFDALGQHDRWTDFNTWLLSAEYKSEREKALEDCPDQGPVACTKHLFDSYNRSYGARRSFMNFIDHVLPEAPRRTLLASVRLIRITPGGAKALPPGHSKKKDALFALRNGFTHDARIHGVARMADGSRFAPASFAEPNRAPFPSNNLYTDRDVVCMVHDWPFSLFTAVSAALGDAVPDFSVDYTVALLLSSGQTIFLKATRSELADPPRRAALFKTAEDYVASAVVSGTIDKN